MSGDTPDVLWEGNHPTSSLLWVFKAGLGDELSRSQLQIHLDTCSTCPVILALLETRDPQELVAELSTPVSEGLAALDTGEPVTTRLRGLLREIARVLSTPRSAAPAMVPASGFAGLEDGLVPAMPCSHIRKRLRSGMIEDPNTGKIEHSVWYRQNPSDSDPLHCERSLQVCIANEDEQPLADCLVTITVPSSSFAWSAHTDASGCIELRLDGMWEDMLARFDSESDLVLSISQRLR